MARRPTIEVVEVLRVVYPAGCGRDGHPAFRPVEAWYTRDGRLIAENDPLAEPIKGRVLVSGETEFTIATGANVTPMSIGDDVVVYLDRVAGGSFSAMVLVTFLLIAAVVALCAPSGPRGPR